MTIREHCMTTAAGAPPGYSATDAATRLRLTAAPRELAALTGKPGAVTYRRLWEAAVSGLIPAELEEARWTVLRSDLPAIARAFGLTVLGSDAPATPDTPRPTRAGRKAAASPEVIAA